MRSYANVETAANDTPTRPVAPQASAESQMGPADSPPQGFQTIGRSALAHPVMVVVLAVLGLVLGVGVGYKHPPTYNATATLMVGRTSGLVEQQVPGLALAVQGLASDYARLVTASNVVHQTEAILHTKTIPGTLNASPVPQSSVIDVTGSASSQAEALAIADAGATALTNVVIQATNDGPAQLQPILKDYEAADHSYQQAQTEVNLYQSQLNSLVGKIAGRVTTPGEAAQEQALNRRIADWQTKADLAKADANVYLNQYNSAVPPLAIQQEMVQQIGKATATGSNRKSYIEAGGLAGAVGGLVIGLALASLVDARRGRRAARATSAA